MREGIVFRQEQQEGMVSAEYGKAVTLSHVCNEVAGAAGLLGARGGSLQ